MFTKFGVSTYVVEMSTWATAGYPHPVSGVLQDMSTMVWRTVVRCGMGEETPDVEYFEVTLADATNVRVYNE